MNSPIPITLVQGKTFRKPLRWASNTQVYRNITALLPSVAPARITAEAHGLPPGWPYWISGAQGARALNSPAPDKPWRAVVVDANTLEINSLNGALLPEYVAGSGWINYLQPIDPTGYTGQLQIRATPDEPALLTLTTAADDGIVIDSTAKTVTWTVTDEQAAGITLPDKGGFWELELTSAAGEVDLYAGGPVLFKREIVKP